MAHDLESKGVLPAAEAAGSLLSTQADLERLHAGDPQAFERIWQRYRPVLEMCVARLLRGVHDPSLRSLVDEDDVLQEAAIVVFRKLDGFEYRGPGSLFAWMQVIATHLVNDRLDHLRADKRGLKSSRSLDGSQATTGTGMLEPADHKAGPVTTAADREERQRLVAAVAELPKREFEILMLRHYYGADWQQIALHVGAPSPDAVRKEHARLLPQIGGRLRA